MSASSSSRATYPASNERYEHAAHTMYDEESTSDDESGLESDDSTPDLYDVYWRQRHDHFVALLGLILRGEVPSTIDGNGDEDQVPDTIDSNDVESDNENLSDAESEVSYEESPIALGKRPRTDGTIAASAKRARVDVATEHGSGDLTTKSSSQPALTEEATLQIILSTVPKTKLGRAHLEQFYSSLQPGPRQLQLLGVRKTKILSKQEREDYLNADEWITEGSVQRWEVVCAGCNKQITLEKPRSDAQVDKGGYEFYPGNWNKHRNGCAEVYRKWCEENGLEADEGTGRTQKSKKKAGKESASLYRPKNVADKGAKPQPTRATGRRASLGSIPVNIIE